MMRVFKKGQPVQWEHPLQPPDLGWVEDGTECDDTHGHVQEGLCQESWAKFVKGGTRKMNMREVARTLGITYDQVYRLIWAGRLRAAKVDGRWVIEQASVEEYRVKRAARGAKTSKERAALAYGLSE